jgi:hypothetical protein
MMNASKKIIHATFISNPRPFFVSMPETTLAKKSRMVLFDFLNAAAFWAADDHF